MALTQEQIDLRMDYWGNLFNTAGERFRNTEEIIDKIKEMAFPTFESNPHSVSRPYKPFTFVHDEQQNSFVSIQQVPSGVSITNIAYWVPWEVKDAYIQSLKSEVDTLNAEVKELKNIVSKLQETL